MEEQQKTERKRVSVLFNQIKDGAKNLQDAVFNLFSVSGNTSFSRVNRDYGDRNKVLEYIAQNNIQKMREISQLYFRTSGIYSRILKYLAFMYKYDWYLYPKLTKPDIKNEKKMLEDYKIAIEKLDKFQIKQKLGAIALKVLIDGVYYGYIFDSNDGGYCLQDLPINYCRSRYNIEDRPAVEFNVQYFDTISDAEQREKILGLFPKEFAVNYRKYKDGKLVKDFPSDEAGWFLLDINKAVKFNLNGFDYPALVQIIPMIIDLAAMQKLDKERTYQRLVKLIIQKLPLDKNDNLLFDMEEARDIHNNAVAMVSGTSGIQVLTSFADVEVEDLDGDSDKQDDDLTRTERQLYNETGVAQMLFNGEGSLALEKSILNDEALMINLVYQFEVFITMLLKEINDKNKKNFILQAKILPTTIYNYKDITKLYKEQTQLGYSLLLPQLALGVSQSSVLNNLEFENNILKLPEKLTPPLSTNTVTAKDLQERKSGGDTKQKQTTTIKTEEKTSGRPEKDIDEKSDKTIRNEEAKANN